MQQKSFSHASICYEQNISASGDYRKKHDSTTTGSNSPITSTLHDPDTSRGQGVAEWTRVKGNYDYSFRRVLSKLSPLKYSALAWNVQRQKYFLVIKDN